VVAKPHGSPARTRRAFPVMITKPAYGNKLGISYEGWPKTNRALAAAYNVDAFSQRRYRWPEILALHSFLLSNVGWEAFAWVPASSCSAQTAPGVQRAGALLAYANYWNEAAFNSYRLMMEKIPASMRSLSVYMTEAGNGATGPYPDQNTGFVNLMFKNVHDWNHVPGHQPIRSVNFYRWRSFDQWGIEAKPGMIADFGSALDPEYTWK
jgi:hypothetical protein